MGPDYPPPGGVTFAGEGDAGRAQGRVNRYSGFDGSAFSQLLWTFNSIANPWHSSQGAGTGQMQFAAFDPLTGFASWQSTANFVTAINGGTASTATRLPVQFQPLDPGAGAALGAGWLEPTTAGDAGIVGLAAPWAVFDVALNPGMDFQVWWRWETSTGQALLDWYDGLQTLGGQARTSISGGFYSAAPMQSVVPEPMSMLLLGTGLAGVGAAARRRRRRGAGAEPA